MLTKSWSCSVVCRIPFSHNRAAKYLIESGSIRQIFPKQSKDSVCEAKDESRFNKTDPMLQCKLAWDDSEGRLKTWLVTMEGPCPVDQTWKEREPEAPGFDQLWGEVRFLPGKYGTGHSGWGKNEGQSKPDQGLSDHMLVPWQHLSRSVRIG